MSDQNQHFKEDVNKIVEKAGVPNHMLAVYFHDIGEAALDDQNEILYPTYSGNSNAAWEIAFSLVNDFLKKNKLQFTQDSFISEQMTFELGFSGVHTPKEARVLEEDPQDPIIQLVENHADIIGEDIVDTWCKSHQRAQRKGRIVTTKHTVRKIVQKKTENP